jgi:pheromone shutdown-related protein TraB
MSNIYVLGTSHISIESIKEVKSTFKEFNPDIIALELDPLRFQALLARKQKRSITKEIQFFGIKGFLLTLVLGYIEKKLGQKVKIKPGTEMLTAIKLAKENKKEIALIDQNIKLTVNNLSKISFREKSRVFFDILRIPFVRGKKVKIDLTKVPKDEFIEKILKEIKIRYPEIYKALIGDRNKVLAKNLNNLKTEKDGKKILAIIGAGHKKEVERLIKNESQ